MTLEVFADRSHEWRWRAVAANGKVIADSAEGYTNKRDCEAGLALLTEALRKDASEVVEIGPDGGRSAGYLHALLAQQRSARSSG